MKFKNILPGILGGLIVAVVMLLFGPTSGGSDAKEETAFDRIMRTGEIKCAYATWPPFLVKDANTGQLSGPSYELMEKIASMLDLKVNWAEEVGWGNYIEGLETGRYDMLCITEWTEGTRVAKTTMTEPVLYTAIYGYVREGDARFDGNLDAVNDASVKIAVMEGDVTLAAAQGNFPKAEQHRLPQYSDGTQPLLEVATGKADVVFVDEGVAHDFMEHNPGQLRKIQNVPAVRIFGEAFAMKKGEFQLKQTFDAMIRELNNQGFVKELVTKKMASTKTHYFAPIRNYEEIK